MVMLIRKISKGSRFNQIYLQKDEMGFEPGTAVLLQPVLETMSREIEPFQYNVAVDKIKKEVIKKIFKIIDSAGASKNILITGSFLEKGFTFEDIDIIVIDPLITDKKTLKDQIRETLGVTPHLIFIDLQILLKGIKQDPLFSLMVDRFVCKERIIFRKDKSINYKLLDVYLLKNKNLIEAFDLFTIKQRKKVIRDFVSIKLFSEDKELTAKSVEKETDRLFGKDLIDKLAAYAGEESKRRFLARFKKEYRELENKLLMLQEKSHRPIIDE
ncbi:MAG TPA: hypothetical protein VJH97_04830 [Candidatus Nanoarchaeia archaeon]|nr:hypothetical protein [Candidatus Nanoarchaeia archaeon]